MRLSRGTATTVPLSGSVVLGRDPVAGVTIASDGVSREHARILWDGKAWWIEDLHSTNGTFVNGEPVAREKLQHLDVISLGRTDMVFVVRSGGPPKTRQGIVRAALVSQDEGVVHEIPRGEVTLGRAVACNIVADGTPISKVHARILRSADQLVLEDLGSVNGTTVNETRVKTAVLNDADLIALAGAVHFRVVVETGVIPDTGQVAHPGRDLEPRGFQGHWRTRYEWDSAERAAFVAAAVGPRSPEIEEAAPQKAPTASPPSTPPPAPAPAETASPHEDLPTVLSRPGIPRPVIAAAPPLAHPPPPTTPPASAAPTALEATPRDEAKTPTVVEMPIPAPRARPSVPATPPIAVIRLAGNVVNLEIREPGRYEIGRATTGSLRVEDNTVSRRHAAVTLDADRSAAWIEDLGAANGTRLNGTGVQGPRVPLASGDQLELGEVRLTVTLERT